VHVTAGAVRRARQIWRGFKARTRAKHVRFVAPPPSPRGPRLMCPTNLEGLKARTRAKHVRFVAPPPSPRGPRFMCPTNLEGVQGPNSGQACKICCTPAFAPRPQIHCNAPIPQPSCDEWAWGVLLKVGPRIIEHEFRARVDAACTVSQGPLA
jgi:hypothetical protein